MFVYSVHIIIFLFCPNEKFIQFSPVQVYIYNIFFEQQVYIGIFGSLQFGLPAGPETEYKAQGLFLREGK